MKVKPTSTSDNSGTSDTPLASMQLSPDNCISETNPESSSGKKVKKDGENINLARRNDNKQANETGSDSENSTDVYLDVSFDSVDPSPGSMRSCLDLISTNLGTSVSSIPLLEITPVDFDDIKTPDISQSSNH